MAEYRIYLRRQTAIRGRHDFEAASDQNAIQIAHLLLDACSDDCDSFDLWSGTRHVAIPRLFVPKTFEELSEVLQERTLDTEERIANGEWHTARSRRLLEGLEGKKAEATFRYLSQAEGHVIQGMANVVRQHETVADLKARGQDTTQAEEFLDRLEQSQALLLARRDKLRRELGRTD
jgi:hypothetical protein